LKHCSSNPRVLARHREGPVTDARERFLTHCAEQGLARESLLRTAREVLIIAKHIDLTTGKAIRIRDVEAAADRWGAHQQRRYRLRGYFPFREVTPKEVLATENEILSSRDYFILRDDGRLQKKRGCASTG
jgi:hypothetical protein